VGGVGVAVPAPVASAERVWEREGVPVPAAGERESRAVAHGEGDVVTETLGVRLPAEEAELVPVKLAYVEPEVEGRASAVTVVDGGDDSLSEGEPELLSLACAEGVGVPSPLVEGDARGEAEKEADTEGEREPRGEAEGEGEPETEREGATERVAVALTGGDLDAETLLVSLRDARLLRETEGEGVCRTLPRSDEVMETVGGREAAAEEERLPPAARDAEALPDAEEEGETLPEALAFGEAVATEAVGVRVPLNAGVMEGGGDAEALAVTFAVAGGDKEAAREAVMKPVSVAEGCALRL